MAKASRPGNQAVAGISSEMTDEERYPTYYATATGNTQSSSSSGTGSSSNKGSTSSKSSSSTTVKNSSTSTKTSSNTGTNAGGYGYPEVQETPYDQKFYAALAAGVPNGINASEYIAKDEAADAVKGVGRLEHSQHQKDRYSEADEEGRLFLWENFRKTGTDSYDTYRSKVPKTVLPPFHHTAQSCQLSSCGILSPQKSDR